jgi:tetratricopeptide (TPR) repeat protein
MADPLDATRRLHPAEAPGPAPDAERWRRIKAIFADVVERERTAREAVLREVAARDPEAADQARSLLRGWEEAASTFLEHGPLLPPAAAEAPDLTGRAIGAYRLTAPLGHGGMGTVYEAVREEDGKRVAIKLLRLRGDPVEVAAHVRAERRILAGLEHDNIARLIDGGATEEGLPFFTMEFVAGRPIVDYCAERGLDVPARLRLFRTVCAAVEYAHQRLVIHCDIKPANILVTAEGVPKLLDFGIARLLQPGDGAGGGAPALPAIAMSPEYASPEQVRGEPVTTATDVYALGLLLYELLTGRRAQALGSLSMREIMTVVCDTAPAPPSAAAGARRRLSGDLDAIVLKALRKQPAERYGSVVELSEEVRRHLESRPVQARGGGAAYRGGRFVRRHRAALAAGALVALSLVGGTAAAVRQAQRAERRLEDVRKLAGSFLFEFHDAIRDLPGATPARRLVVAKALEYLDRLARETGGDLELVRELAVAYQRVGDVQGYPANPNLGDTQGAAASYRKALALAERLVAAAPEEAAARALLGRTHERLGATLAVLGESDGAGAALARAQELLEEVARERPRDGEVAHDLHVVHLRRGDLRWHQGDLDAALAHYEAARRLDEQVLAAAPGGAHAKRDLAVALSRVGNVWGERDPARGLALFSSLLGPAQEALAADPTSAELRRDLLVGHEDVAQMHAKLGDWPAALEHQLRALALAEELVRADPANEQALQDLSVRHAQIGDVLAAMARPEEALASYRRSLDIDARIAAGNPDNSRAAEYLGWSHLNVAGMLVELGDAAAARDHFRQAIAAVAAFAGRDPSNADLREVLAEARAGLGEGAR